MLSKLYSTNIKKKNRPALLTFTVAGDNSLKKSQEIIENSNNADIIELGFPHNTPIKLTEDKFNKVLTELFRTI